MLVRMVCKGKSCHECVKIVVGVGEKGGRA